MRWDDFDRGVFLVNLLAIIPNGRGEILIGRREKDPYIKELSWSFPGGRPSYEEDLEEYLKLEVKKKTNLDIDIKKIMFSKTYPEDRRFLSIYYLVGAKNLGEEKAGEKFVEIKWVKPSEIKKYFTTSIHLKLLEIITEC
jgi:ADP-ribose pyrophosphatase YjhB (NUDIX family)